MTERERSTAAHPSSPSRAAGSGNAQPAPLPPPQPSLPRSLVLGVPLIIGFAIATFGFANSATSASYTCAQVLPAPVGSVGPEGITTESLGQAHVAASATTDYGFCPPTSGPHYSGTGLGPLQAGIYGPNAEAKPGGWVHNLEHGYVVVLYRGADSDPARIESWIAALPQTPGAAACGLPAKLLVARFNEMATPYAVLAWDRFLPLETWDPAAASTFAARWIDTSAPESGAC